MEKKSKGMQLVQPIRDRAKIEEMKAELKSSSERDYLLFTFGINTGLRISDILEVKVSDVRDKTHLLIRENKTDKVKRFLINQQLKKDLDEYTKDMEDDEYLFQSQKGNNKPISRVQAYRILNAAAEKVGLEEIGTHTLRKTFGYWHYKTYGDVAILQELLNHSAPSVTLRYIGINQDSLDDTIKGFYL